LTDLFSLHTGVISARVFHRDGKYGEFVVATRARQKESSHIRCESDNPRPLVPSHSHPRLWSLRQFSPTSVHVMRSCVDGHLLPRLNNPVKATFSRRTREQRIIELLGASRKMPCDASRHCLSFDRTSKRLIGVDQRDVIILCRTRGREERRFLSRGMDDRVIPNDYYSFIHRKVFNL